MPTSEAAGLRFGEVGGVTVYVKDNVAGGVSYFGIGVCGGVVEEPESVGVRFIHAFCLLQGDGTKGVDHGWVDRNGIVYELPRNLLHQVDFFGGQERRRVVV